MDNILAGSPDPQSLSIAPKVGIHPRSWLRALKNRNRGPSIEATFLAVTFLESARIESMYGGGKWQIGRQSIIGSTLLCENPNARISIGESCYLASGTLLNSMESIEIGCNVMIATDCIIQDHNSHSLDPRQRREELELARQRILGRPNLKKDFSAIERRPIVIEDDVWIGFRSAILKGVRIGRGAVVALGSVVTKDVPSGTIVAGNPARVVKEIKIDR